jgi:hypothetical protein
MARRFILIEVGDDTAAQEAREGVTMSQHHGHDVKIVGEFLRPDDFCDHGNWVTEPGKPAVTQIRHDKIGWRICTKCYKPVPSMDFLVNQIKPQDIDHPEHEVVRGKDLGFYVYGLSAASLRVNKDGQFT